MSTPNDSHKETGYQLLALKLPTAWTDLPKSMAATAGSGFSGCWIVYTGHGPKHEIPSWLAIRWWRGGEGSWYFPLQSVQESCRVTIRCEYFKSSFQELQPVWSSGGWAAVPPIPSWLLGLLALAAEPDSAGDSDRKTHTWLGCTMGIPVQMTQSAATDIFKPEPPQPRRQQRQFCSSMEHQT